MDRQAPSQSCETDEDVVSILGSTIIVTATSNDGVIEAIESKQYPNVLGVQFHPECMAEEDPYSQRIFNWLVNRSKEIR